MTKRSEVTITAMGMMEARINAKRRINDNQILGELLSSSPFRGKTRYKFEVIDKKIDWNKKMGKGT